MEQYWDLQDALDYGETLWDESSNQSPALIVHAPRDADRWWRYAIPRHEGPSSFERPFGRREAPQRQEGQDHRHPILGSGGKNMTAIKGELGGPQHPRRHYFSRYNEWLKLPDCNMEPGADESNRPGKRRSAGSAPPGDMPESREDSRPRRIRSRFLRADAIADTREIQTQLSSRRRNPAPRELGSTRPGETRSVFSCRGDPRSRCMKTTEELNGQRGG